MSVVEMFFLGIVALAVGLVFLVIGVVLILFDKNWQAALRSEDLRLQNVRSFLSFLKDDLERKYGIKITERRDWDEKLHC